MFTLPQAVVLAYFPAVPRTAAVCVTMLLSVASCHRPAETPQGEVPRPLAGFAAQRVAVTPTAHVRAADSLGWVQQLSGARSVARQLDTNIVAVLDARGLARRWVMPAELAKAYERNRSYATDPYQLVVEQLRSPRMKPGERYGEPLSSQLRTMIALQEDTRFVLLPVDLRFERAADAAGQGRAVLRVALLDPRFAEARWIGDVTGNAAATPALALSSVAAHLADLFVAP